MSFFVACSKGLEPLLAEEMLALGAAKASAHVAGVAVQGDLVLAQRAVLHSRLASRVLWPLAEFDCGNEHDLYQSVQALPWAEHLAADGTLAVSAHVSGPDLTHERYAAQRVKDAVVDHLRAQSGVRPSVDVEDPDLRLDLVVRKGRATLSVDLGGSLHRRGWRQAQGEAPLKETLAAAVLMRGGWPKVYREGGALLDPMCGSGTLLIEAAQIAANEAPGLRRHGEALPCRWRGFDVAGWRALRSEALAAAAAGRAALRPVLVGRDSDARVLVAARDNAANAGYADAIRFERGDVASLPPVEGSGLVVCNPPYDQRLAADPALYRELGDALRRACPTWRAALLCGSEELAFATGLRAGKKYTLFNGALECRLIVCDPIQPPQRNDTATPRAAKTLSDGAQMVANRLGKNLHKLKRWREREGVTCYRLYDADLPEYAAAIDVYQEAEGEQRLFLHVQEYAAPASIPEADTRRRFGELLDAVRATFPECQGRIAIKTRARGKGGSKYGRMDQRSEFIVVREGSAKLRVNLFDYLDTGLFLDHRPVRLRIGREATGQRMLNLFCYTGAASVHAGVGGALSTTSVDLSGTYLEWAAGNLALNGLSGSRHRLVQADAVAWLEAERGEYDLIFCDPPTFSNSKRADDFDTQRDHVRLLRAAVARLAPDGVLIFSNNFRRFRLDEEAVQAFAQVREISAATIPPDFERNARIHRCWELRPLR